VSTDVVEARADTPIRLDAFVRALLPDVSRRVVRALVDGGEVLVNGRPARKGVRLVPGDLVTAPRVGPLAPEPALPLAVLYEDEQVIAVDKPGGVPCHALDPRERGTVAAALLARHPELAGVGDPLAPGLAHRLDTGTSGVLVAARSPAAFARLRAAFRAHAVRKRYVALVDGRPDAGAVLDVPLAHDTGDRRRMRAAQRGDRAWPALTTVLAVTPLGARSRVDLEIATGVTHQIRVHLALAGHPVAGDALYGGSDVGLRQGRHALHARSLALPDPPRVIESPLPPDLLAILGG
jgi:23S rRNA pseudouridine1911/1915/1917 synthase